MANLFSRVLLSITLISFLAGCGAVIVGGAAATTAVVATDRRTTGEQIDDQTIELRVASEMEQAFGDKARILGTSYAGRLLIVGDVPTQADKQKAQEIASKITKVRHVDNFLRVGDITPLSVRTNDTWITSKVKSNLIATENVPSRTIKITTERGIVYLMGKVTDSESDRAAAVASSITGVNKVVKLFDIVSPTEILDGDTQVSDTPSASASKSNGAQAMPVK